MDIKTPFREEIEEMLQPAGFSGRPSRFQAGLIRRGLPGNSDSERTRDASRQLAHIHKDPLDRLLIAQATAEGITLWTSAETITKDPGPIRFV